MNEAQRYEIAVLAEEAESKRRIFDALGTMNRRQDPDEQMAQTVKYRIAEAEWREAESKLRQAMNKLGAA